jgi:hypothetical protein
MRKFVASFALDEEDFWDPHTRVLIQAVVDRQGVTQSLNALPVRIRQPFRSRCLALYRAEPQTTCRAYMRLR